MTRIKDESLRALNSKLDIVRVLEEIGVVDIADTHPEVLSSCPFHAGTSIEAVLTVDKKTKTAICDEATCLIAHGEPLIETYARAMGRTLGQRATERAPPEFALEEEPDEGVEPAAADADAENLPEIPLTPEEEAAGLAYDEAESADPFEASAAAAPAPPPSLSTGEMGLLSELASEAISAAPAMAGAEIHAQDIDAPAPDPPLEMPDPLRTAAVAAVSPHETVKFQVPEGAPVVVPMRADRAGERAREEEAVLRYLLGDDPAALHEIGSLGITDVDFRAGGSGPPGLSLHGAIFAAFRRIGPQPATGAVLDLISAEHRASARRVIERLAGMPNTDHRGFRQHLRRLADMVLKENLESALRASITDITAHPNEDAHSLLGHARERVNSLGRFGIGPLVTQEVAMPDLLDRLLNRDQVPIPTFSDGLNKLLNGGIQFGHLLILTGGAGSGKTAFLLQLADGIAAGNPTRMGRGLPAIPVLYITTSSSRRDLTIRSLSRLTKMNAGALFSKRWISGWEGDFLESEIDINEEVESVSSYYDRRIREGEEAYKAMEPHVAIVEVAPWITVDDIRSYVIQALRRFRSTAVVLIVDSLQHVAPSSSESGRHKVGDEHTLEIVTAELKYMCTTLGIPVVASVDSTYRSNNRTPVLQTMADVILGLTIDEDILQAGNVKHAPAQLTKKQIAFKELLDRIREEYPLEFSHSEYAVVEPLKHRTGPQTPVVFTFNKAWHSFEEMEP
ncbi:MAG: DnaB-like helicase C-terminal domain-containing protein [Acidobacteriota bacterium]